MKSITKILSISMIATMLLGFAAIFPMATAFYGDYPHAGTLFVDPPNNIFTGSYIGSTFMVNVSIANTTGFMGISFHLAWDPTLLQVQSMTELFFHSLDPTNIWNLKFTFNNTAGTADYTQLWQDGNLAISSGYAPCNVTTDPDYAPYVYPEGKTGACAFVFKILKNAPFHSSLSCALALSDVKVGDVLANAIPVTVVNGLFQINWAPPIGNPYFSVIPPTYTASNVGEVFNISVLVNNLNPGWAAVGFEFKLSYNATILQLLSVTEGPWLPPYGALPNQGTLFMTLYGAGIVTVGDVVMPMINGSWNPPFPSAPNPGTQAMAILTFNATMQGLFPTVLSSALTLSGMKVGDYLGGSVSTGPGVNGFYSIKPKVLGRAIDIFVGQDGFPYPFPYGGQGPNAPADMFWPQKQVCVWAYVTYNEWPEQQKDVAIEIFDPHGTRWGIIYARTNATGYAYTCFRLPWPCDDPEYYIGVWTVVGTVDVACEIINDTVTFHYDYLVRIWKVTADPQNVYKHNSTVCYTVEYGSHAQQFYNVTIAITGLDETGVPFGFAYKQVEIGGTVYCQYKNYTDTLCIYIPKWARAGQGEVDVAILDNWPYLGGTVQSGYWTGSQWLGYAPTPINIEAAWA
jgi:hypothetical protein